MSIKQFLELPGGIKMPSVGLGTWQASDENELELALNTALEVGYRHIDTAFLYENEEVIGRVLNRWFSSGKLKREDIFLTTKLPVQGVHEDRVERFMKKSLDNLKLDYVDLYLIHFPIGNQCPEDNDRPKFPDFMAEPVTDHIAIWKKMEEQVDAGRTKTIGLSNFNSRQIERISNSARIKPACLQIELHVYLQQRELVDYCQQHNIAVVAYSPLGSPGYNNFMGQFGVAPKKLPDMLNDITIKKIATKHGKTTAQILLRYLLQRNVAVIPKSVSASRLKENINVFNFSLDAADMKTLEDLEIGEDARVCNLHILPKLRENPEWPFPK